jgi:hypothetical protein
MAFTLNGFAAHLAGLAIQMAAAERLALELAAQIVEKEAKAEIGHKQGAAGPFPAWDQLADSTIYGFAGNPGKAALGFAPPDFEPLLRQGDMRDSIQHVVIGKSAHVGSDSDVAVWQELGTINMPPRSFLGGAAVRKKAEIGRRTGLQMTMFLSGLGTGPITRIP